MAGFKLGWQNYLFTAPDDTLTLSGGAVTVGDLSALRDPRLARRCTISADSADGVATIGVWWQTAGGSGDLVPLSVLGLLNYQIAAAGATVTIGFRIYTAIGVTVVASVPVPEPPSDDWSRHLWHLLGYEDQVYGAMILITATWPEGEEGTLDLTSGAMWAGPIWSPPDGLDATWTQSVIDPGQMRRSSGGQGYPRRKARYRVFEGRAVHVPFAWAFGDPDDPSVMDIQQIQYRVGTTGYVALFPRTLDAAGDLSSHAIHRLGIYGHFADVGRLEHLGGDLYQWTQVRLEELL